MGQKVHPTGIRLGIIKDWTSTWYADSKNYAEYLNADIKVKNKDIHNDNISNIEVHTFVTAKNAIDSRSNTRYVGRSRRYFIVI